jgi:uncharacterized protein YbaA (DUF1428 family)
MQPAKVGGSTRSERMARYVDGFLLPVPKKNLATYRKIAAKAGKVWREHGALQYCECVGDDLNIKGVKSFIQQVRPKSGEVIFFSFIIYKSRKHRDQVNAKVMKDPRMDKMMQGGMPFDPKRMCYGGFKILVDA